MQLNPVPVPSVTGGASLSARLVAAAIALPIVAPAIADTAPERGQISIKHLDYLDSQPGEDRIRVRATALGIVAPLSGEWSIGGSVVRDAISGASPYYQSSGLTRMQDQRRALELNVSRYLADATITVGANVSTESDYLSRGVSVLASRSDETRNTTWSIGLSATGDTINPTNHIVVNETRRVGALLLGLTRVLTPEDIVQVNAGFSSGHGYYSDPYKFADDRPRERRATTAMIRWNHHVGPGTSRVSYRYFDDDWGIRAHTLGLEYVQPLADGWMLTPLVRVHSQSAARFHVPADASAFPFAPDPNRHYSEDQRLSAFGARTIGLRIDKRIDADWRADIKIEQYGQRGAWRLFGDGSTGLAPFNARSIQAGISRLF